MKPQRQGERKNSVPNAEDLPGSGKQIPEASNKPAVNRQPRAVAGATGQGRATESNKAPRLALFDHLSRKVVNTDRYSIEADRVLHPAIIHLGTLMAKGILLSDDDRAQALISVFCAVIVDYKTPPKKILREDLDKYISKQVQHLVDSRQLSKGMGNIIKFVKSVISKVNPETSEADAKAHILTKIQTFMDERMEYAADSIANHVTSTIENNDVILTFGSSPLVRKVLLAAAKTKKFRLVIVDTRPLSEGLETLTALSSVVHCIYTPLCGAAVTMADVNRVILGASCLFSNGSMLAPAGTAMIAALAQARRIPVIVASETYKFSDKVQLDSIVFNELGNPSEITSSITTTDSSGDPATDGLDNSASLFSRERMYRGSVDRVVEGGDSGSGAKAGAGVGGELISTPINWNAVSNSGSTTQAMPYQVVNLRYDLTPLANISVVATEAGMIPPTSVPVLVREMLHEQGQSHN